MMHNIDQNHEETWYKRRQHMGKLIADERSDHQQKVSFSHKQV